MMNLEEVTTWCEAALADGWEASKLYASEPIETAAWLALDGWTAFIFRRLHDTSVVVWAPDRLAVKAPLVYRRQALMAGSHTCNYCGKVDCVTQRVGFAGRCCLECLPAKRKELEYPGWYN